MVLAHGHMINLDLKNYSKTLESLYYRVEKEKIFCDLIK